MRTIKPMRWRTTRMKPQPVAAAAASSSSRPFWVWRCSVPPAPSPIAPCSAVRCCRRCRRSSRRTTARTRSCRTPAMPGQRIRPGRCERRGSAEKLVSREEQPVDVPAPVNAAPRVVSTIPIFPGPDTPVRPAVGSARRAAPDVPGARAGRQRRRRHAPRRVHCRRRHAPPLAHAAGRRRPSRRRSTPSPSGPIRSGSDGRRCLRPLRALPQPRRSRRPCGRAASRRAHAAAPGPRRAPHGGQRAAVDRSRPGRAPTAAPPARTRTALARADPLSPPAAEPTAPRLRRRLCGASDVAAQRG